METTSRSRLQRHLNAFAAIRKGCQHYGVPLWQAIPAALWLYGAKQFSLKEIVGYGLYVPSLRAQKPVMISKQGSLAKLKVLNPPGSAWRTSDKIEFYKHCIESDLPVPKLVAVFSHGKFRNSSFATFEARQDARDWLDDELPTDFVVKDARGAYASGFEVFSRSREAISQEGGSTFDMDGFIDHVCANPSRGRVIQERLFDHPRLRALSGLRGLQTMRVNTLLSESGVVEVLYYFVKLVRQGHLTDNFAMGASGNMIAFGDRDTGILKGAARLHPCGSGLDVIEAHPETGNVIKGFEVPLWEETIELAKEAHLAFPEVKSLAWDIAITEDGPRLLEANASWDPPPYFPDIMSAESWRRIFA